MHKHARKIIAPQRPYVPAVATDIRKTFERIRREQRASEIAKPWRDEKRVVNLGDFKQ